MNKTSKRKVLLLHLEDNENDQILVREMLHADDLPCETVVVKTRDDFSVALKKKRFDLIISDFSLPSFDGLSALSLARELSPQTPFIFFSGTIGEEVAVETLKNGATDYVLKQRPFRLIGAVRNALRAAGERARLQCVEDELRQLDQRLRIVASASNDVVWEWDIKTDRVWFSENFQNILGFKREEIGAHLENWQNLIHPDERGRVTAGLVAMLAGGGRIWWSEHRLRRANGSYLHVYDRASVIYDSAGKALRIVGVVIDMTERKQSEEKIREQAELLDKAQDAIIVCGLDHSILYWNKGAERIYGWTSSDVIGKNTRSLFFHDNVPRVAEEADKILEERGEWIGELPEFTKENKTVIVQAHAVMIRDERGHPKSLLIINTDITERKQLEEQFLRAQRLESLGALVGGIAHDLNNALVPIVVGVDILQQQKLSGDAYSMVQTMKTSARRSAEMVKQMLIFARGGETKKTVIRPAQLIEEMSRIIGDTFPKTIQCRVRAEKDAPLVYGIPTQLHQVLLNLCVNARDAMPRGGTLTLSAQSAEISIADAQRHHVKSGDFLCITVADSGEGIAPDVQEKIFLPFFTTKGLEKGTGLGLSTSQTIIKSHGGFIAVQSKIAVGTEFKVYLPATVDKVAPAAAQKPPLPAGNGECILLVDDEESILAITRAALQNFGYDVLVAENGIEAVSVFSKNFDTIKLVITDLAMPVMDGPATIAALRKIRSDVKIIVASGTEKELEESLPRLKTDAIVLKPFTNEKLLETVHHVLSETQVRRTDRK